MDHESAAEHLLDLHGGALDERTHAELDAHLETCESCREQSRFLDRLRSVVPAEIPDWGRHPSSHEIVDFSIDPEALHPDNRQALDRHVASCSACREEVDRVRHAAETRPEPFLGRMSSHRIGFGFAVAASILAAALIYPAFLGAIRLPRVLQQLEASRSGAAAQLQFVRSALRDGSEGNVVTLDASQPYVLLGIEMAVPRELPDSELMRVDLGVDASSPAVTLNLTAGEARRQIETASVVTIVVPSESLATGRNELRVTLANQPSARPVFRAAVRVQTSDR